jgi:hypothetical protein
MMSGLLPTGLYLFLYYSSNKFRTFVLARRLRTASLVQSGRILGSFGFFAAYWGGLLPGRFALPTAITDLLWGLTALFAAFSLVTPHGLPKPGFVAWNIGGLLALLTSSTLGIVTGPTRLGILAEGLTSQAVTAFPLNLVPTFFGPVTMVCHVICLQIARQKLASSRSDSEEPQRYAA